MDQGMSATQASYGPAIRKTVDYFEQLASKTLPPITDDVRIGQASFWNR
jgi:hypothetical protein